MIKSKRDKKSFELNQEDDVKTFANKQEKLIAKKLGGKQTINSGSIPTMPGDVYLGTNFIEIKSARDAKQIIVTEDMLKKLEDQSSSKGKNPVLMLNFPKCKKIKHKQWVLLPVEEKNL